MKIEYSVQRNKNIKIGCCGWPEGRTTYQQDFEVVEVQETFCRPGSIEKYEKWRRDAPHEFEFVVKAWQLITHEPSNRKLRVVIPERKKNRYGSFRPSPEIFAAWEVTAMIAQALDAKTILFRSPASFAPSAEHERNIRTFFNSIDRQKGYVLINNLPMLHDARRFRRLIDGH